MNPHGSDVIIQNDIQPTLKYYSINKVKHLSLDKITNLIESIRTESLQKSKVDLIIDFCFDTFPRVVEADKLDTKIHCFVNYLNSLVGRIDFQIEIVLRGCYTSSLWQLYKLDKSYMVMCKSDIVFDGVEVDQNPHQTTLITSLAEIFKIID